MNNTYPYNNTTLTAEPDTITLNSGLFAIDPNKLTIQGLSGANILVNHATMANDYTWNIHKPLEVTGDATFNGDLILKGKSLSQTLENIEERLAILRPNEKLEEKWENLRGLRKMYMELEQEILEKEKMWDIIKK
jgi:hypothetical protein